MGTEADTWGRLRRDVVWINGASRSPLPSRTLAVGLAAVAKKAETPWNIGDAGGDKQAIRGMFAELIGQGAQEKDVALVPSCSYAMSLAAANLRSRMIPGRNQVLVLADQMHSNVLPWQLLCADTGGSILKISRPADYDWADAVVRALSHGNVAICALPPCHWCDGAIVDLSRVGDACRRHGVALVVDGTQWIGAADCIEAVSIGACFVACSVHKWLLCPYGCCLCYASPDFWRTATPLEHHDRNREGAQHVECLPMDAQGNYPLDFQDGACRLDSGGRPSYILMPMIRESLTLLLRSLTVRRVVETLRDYTSEIASRAKSLGFEVPPRHAPNIVGLRCTACMPTAEAIVERLAQRSPPVLVSERFGAIRVSPHLWNRRDDIEHLFAGLVDAIAESRTEPHSRL